MTIVVTPPHTRRLTKPCPRSFSLSMKLSGGARVRPAARTPERSRYSIRREVRAVTSAFALCAIAVGIAQKLAVLRQGGLSTSKGRDELSSSSTAPWWPQIPAPAREGTRAELSSLEASHAKY